MYNNPYRPNNNNYNLKQNTYRRPYYLNNDGRCPYCGFAQMMNLSNVVRVNLQDYGPNPLIIDIDEAAARNQNFRTTLWTGEHLQLTLMSIPVGGEVGIEMHPDVDQVLLVEDGEGLVLMGDSRDNLSMQEIVDEDYLFIVPAGTWHNIVNTGDEPVKLVSVYAPPQHPHGTVHVTKEDSDRAEQEME